VYLPAVGRLVKLSAKPSACGRQAQLLIAETVVKHLKNENKI